MSFIWTPQAEEALSKLVALKLSASQISKMLFEEHGIKAGRNAILGKCWRMKLKPNQGKHARPPVERRAAPKLPKLDGVSVSSFPPSLRRLGEPTGGVPFGELSWRCCRYELGGVAHHAKSFRFCGDPAAAGAPYCATHMRVAYQPRERKRGR